MKPEQQTKMFSTAEYKGLQARKKPKSNIPTWQWLQNTKVLKIWILKIEKDKISLSLDVMSICSNFIMCFRYIIIRILLGNGKSLKTMETQ